MATTKGSKYIKGGALISKSHGLPVVAWFFEMALYFGLK